MIKVKLGSIKQKKKRKMPFGIKPMLATLVDEPPEDANGWKYEIKWDGFRMLTYLNNGKVELKSRNNKGFNSKFYPIYNELKQFGFSAIFDGEIIMVNEKGLPDFEGLQLWRSEADGDLIYYVLDLLWFEGYDLMEVPLSERRELLMKLLSTEGMIRYSETFDNSQELLRLTEQMGLEGIIAKNINSLYKPDLRSKEWLKIKAQNHQEAVIAGYTRNENTPKKFSSLILGIYEGDELVPITPVGTGFNAKMQREILEKLKPIETEKCPFKVVPDLNKPSRFRPNPPKVEVTWVKPELVAEISYRTIASDGSYRHPSFKRLREDKNPKKVVREEPLHAREVIGKEHELVKMKMFTAARKPERKTLLNPKDETQVRDMEGHNLKFTSLSKIYWPKEKITKRDMINYYYQVAPYLLPYLKDRPQTLNRFLYGVEKKSFYQKDVKGKVPSWIKRFDYYSETDKRNKEFLMVNDEASLFYILQILVVSK